jgi:transcriptional regulator with XRE-family HTH domain
MIVTPSKLEPRGPAVRLIPVTNKTRALIAKNVHKFRIRSGVSAEKIAEILGMPPEDYLDREAAKDDFTSVELFQISRVFGVTMEQIFAPPGGNN